MAEDTRKVVFYKNVEYYIVEDKGVLLSLEEVGASHNKKLVEKSVCKTPEEQAIIRENTRSQHVNWIR